MTSRRVGLLPPETTSDATLLIATRGTRGLVDGLVSLALAAYLPLLGYSATRVGVVVAGMMLGSAAATLAVGTIAHRLARRRLLMFGALVMIASGLGFAATTAFVPLFVVGLLGTMNPTSGDVSVFLPLEQSVLTTTTVPTSRTSLFARYTFVAGVAGGLGALAARLPDRIARHTGISLATALRGTFLAYAAAGVVVLVLYRALSERVEPDEAERPTALVQSRAIVYRLAAVFSLDSFAGGFVVQSLLALWLFRRFDLSLGAAGTLLFVTGTLSAASGFAAARLARRIGLVRTMVFTHLPAQVFLIGAALSPNLALALGLLIARSLLSAMDVPARNSYVMAVVSSRERAAAASITNVPRSLAAVLPPIAAGWMLDHSTIGWPLIVAGTLKIAYDLTLLAMFHNVHPPEEKALLAAR